MRSDCVHGSHTVYSSDRHLSKSKIRKFSVMSVFTQDEFRGGFGIPRFIKAHV